MVDKNLDRRRVMLTQKTVSNLLKPLVIAGLYKNEGAALKNIVVDYIGRKIEAYDAVIKEMQKKHGKDFNKFTNILKNKAATANEDDWMEWKASILMKESWKDTLEVLLKDAA
jgi:hypothetical protein